MMRPHCIYSIMLSALLLTTISSSAWADLETQQFVDSFNGMNGSQGYLFNRRISQTGTSAAYGTKSGEIRLENNADPVTGQTPALLAYQQGVTGNNGTGTAFYFQTFCVAPELLDNHNEPSSGLLNYASNRTTTYNGVALTLGVAYLYKEFAAGMLANYNYTYGSGRINSAELLQDAIWHLMGLQGQDRFDYMAKPDTNWDNNVFLAYLRSIESDINFWLAAYDPANDYDGLMGYAKVFVMRVISTSDAGTRSIGTIRQDVLYVASACEPATILLWTLGSLSAAGVACRKRRKLLSGR